MEVRHAYAAEEFEWDNCKRVAVEDINESNLGLMRAHAQTKFKAMLENEGGTEGGGGGGGTEGASGS